MLTWSSTNATSCTASGAWSGTKATSGSQSTGTLTTSSTYNLSCSGSGGSASQSATVTVSGTGTLSFSRVVVDSASPSDPWEKTVGDLNGDGITDLVVGAANGPIVWYQSPTWTKRTIANSGGSESGSATGDIDGDGDVDVVVGMVWYENVNNGQSWVAHTLPGGSAGTHDIVVADVNNDGRNDIVMRGETAATVWLFLQGSGGTWTVLTLNPGVGLNGLDVADVNGDKALDIVVGGVWIQNPGGAATNAASWTKRTFTSGWDSYAAVKVVDMNGDGHPDIVLSVSENVGKLSWFEAPADATSSSSWTEHAIGTGLDHVHGFVVADVDHDGVLDVAASEYAGQGRLIVYLQRGSGWQANTIGTDSLHNMHALDFNHDGNVDFFGVYGWGVNPVIVYQNTSPPPPKRVLVYSLTLGFRHDSIPTAIAAIQQMGASNGFQVDATEDPTKFTPANLSRYRAIVFLSPSGDILNAAQRQAFQQFVENGGGFVGIHNANALVLDDWQWYGKLVGARYVSEISTQPLRLRILDASHISTSGLPDPWNVTMEAYNWDVNPKVNGAHVLINLDESSVSGGTMGSDHPFSWYHPFDGGPSWYTVGGAEIDDWQDANFLRHVLGGIRYGGGF